jgi:hypothetical protein
MKQKYIWISLIILILIIGAIFIFYPKQNQSVLPNSVTIKIYGDWTSSGGGRLYDSTLIFVNGKLTNGWQKYDYSGGTGIENHYECIVDVNTLTWRDKTTLGACGYNSSFIPLDLAGLREKINSGDIKPVDGCLHYDTCYKILE